MAFTVTSYAQRRPYLYHLTAASNLTQILASRTLRCAADLLAHVGRADLQAVRRPGHVLLIANGMTVTLRDQAPLYERNMQLDCGWTLSDFVTLLNQRVFFWPGTASDPIDYGVRHFRRYEGEEPVILRVPFASTCAANPNVPPLFSKHNSGSPRWSGGKPSPRGAATFLSADQAPFGAGAVVEVTFCGQVLLPADTECRMTAEELWRPL